MHETGFTKLFSSIVTSTIWQEDDKTRIVWITMLALSNRYGEVGASIPGLAMAANVSIEDCQKSLEKLKSPDPYSRSKEHEGRRVKEVEGGFLILNYGHYREKMRSRAEYFKEYRQRNKNATTLTNPQPIAEAEAEAEKKEIYKEKNGAQIPALKTVPKTKLTTTEFEQRRLSNLNSLKASHL